MVCAIYPRKSKANDNSQSMEQQIDDCKRYINEHYPNATIKIYDGDYALTGHSTVKRKDFLRMMEDIKKGEIQTVVIMRYDRIARNMRDFCNLYHTMEENNCNLVSVSQQIDTSTPYGKNFMYQMAAMAELEWAIISERYKDTANYKASKGYAYTGRLPIGFKIEKDSNGNKRVVKDNPEMIIDIFQYLLKTHSKRATVEYVQKNYIPDFSRHKLRTMIDSDLFMGKAHGNDNFCEPYFTEKEMQEIRSLNQIKKAPSGRVYIFSGMFTCPVCGYKMAGFYSNNKNSTKRTYYRCWHANNDKPHLSKMVSQEKTEKWLLDTLGPQLDSVIYNSKVNEKKIKEKDNSNQIADLQNQIDRINYMFEKGRLDIDSYESKYSDLTKQIEMLKEQNSQTQTDKALQIIKDLPDNWKDIYNQLDNKHKQLFWNGIITEIILDDDFKPCKIVF